MEIWNQDRKKIKMVLIIDSVIKLPQKLKVALIDNHKILSHATSMGFEKIIRLIYTFVVVLTVWTDLRM